MRFTFTAIAAGYLAAFAVLPAHASSFPTNAPCFGPFCHAAKSQITSAARTAGAPAATNTVGVLSALVNVEAQVVSDIQTADGLASTINPATGTMWDPIGHMCYAGIGTPGTPGYVAGLLAFIQGLPTPASLPTAPNGSGGLVTAQEDARLVVIATRTAINNIAAIGYPTALMQACGSLVNDDANGLVVGSVGVNALLLKWIPGAAIGAIALPKI